MSRKGKDRGFQWVREDQDEAAVELAVRPDRDGIRAEARALDALANRLAALTPAQRALVPLYDELAVQIEVLSGCGRRTHRARQLRRVQGMLRSADLDAIQAALEGDTDTSELHRELVRWRDQILADGDARAGDDAIERFLEIYPTADRQQLRLLARAARGGSTRKLYQALVAAAGVAGVGGAGD